MKLTITPDKIHSLTDAEYRRYEARLRRSAIAEGLLLRKSRRRQRTADDYGLYVLVQDKAGNRLPGATAAMNAFARGEGMNLAEVECQLLGGFA